MPLYTVFWDKLSIVKELPGNYSNWNILFTIDEDGNREASCGLIGHKMFFTAYEFPDDKSALLWFKLEYGG
jgi:hypothetical protein